MWVGWVGKIKKHFFPPNHLVLPQPWHPVVERRERRLQERELRVQPEEEEHEEEEDGPQPGEGQARQGLRVHDEGQACARNLAFFIKPFFLREMTLFNAFFGKRKKENLCSSRKKPLIGFTTQPFFSQSARPCFARKTNFGENAHSFPQKKLYLPCPPSATLSTSTSNSVARNPRTENMTQEAMSEVRKSSVETTEASMFTLLRNLLYEPNIIRPPLHVVETMKRRRIWLVVF